MRSSTVAPILRNAAVDSRTRSSGTCGSTSLDPMKIRRAGEVSSVVPWRPASADQPPVNATTAAYRRACRAANSSVRHAPCEKPMTTSHESDAPWAPAAILPTQPATTCAAWRTYPSNASYGSGGQARPVLALVLGERIVRVAIQPAFTFFSRGDHRMAAAASMSAGVAIARGVATPRPTAGLTRSQMHPPRTDRDALLTHPRSGLRDRLHRLDVRTSAALSSHR
jgi:hypothetical protein